MSADLSANAERFSGFADLYDQVRPTPPDAAADMLRAYAGVARPVVVDLGAGTGLSTRWCARWAGRTIGVEPSDDMRAVAMAASPHGIEWVNGWSHATGLPDATADLVVIVQALHWMEPVSTFTEVARVLRPGGVFAALDCDWPPSIGNCVAEAAWDRCRGLAKAYEARLAAGESGDALTAPLEAADEQLDLPVHFGRDPNKHRQMAVGVQAWSKDEHLGRMMASGLFRSCREVALHQAEDGGAERFIDLLRTQGDVQTLIKHGVSEDRLGVTEFAADVRDAVGTDPRSMWFTYRMRIGIT